MKASLTLLEDFFRDCDRSNWGYSKEQITAAEAKLSVSFPKVLRQYYTRFGACPYIQDYGNNIPVPLALEDLFIPDSTYNAPHYVPKELDFLVFYSIVDVSAIDYGIRLSDLILEDPPVYFCDYGDTSWRLENPSLLNFLVTSAFWQMAEESRLDYSLNIDSWDFYSLQEQPNLAPYRIGLGMNDHELEVLSTPVRYYRIFLRDGVLLACETDEWAITEPPWDFFEWLTVASTNREKIQAIKKIPDLRWELT